MTVLRHEATYQGLPGKGVEYRRSPGFNPEHGWIDIDMADLGKIEIHPREIPWRAANQVEMNGALDIFTWLKLRSRVTVTTPPAIPAPKGGGLNLFGDLILTTYDDTTGGVVGQTTYHDVYVASSGIEEITRDLAEIESHAVGTVRVPLTDIRRWYQKCGGLFCRINCRLSSGEWDPITVKDAETPFSALEVLEFLFSQLPGSPLIVGHSEVKKLKLNPPTDIVGEGEPVVQHLEKLLERLSLEAGLLEDNNYVVSRKLSSKFGHKQVPKAGGGVARGPKALHYERRTAYVGDRPPLVLVFGRRRIRRITVPYIAVLQDTDGRWYPIEVIAARWGYSMRQINAGAFIGAEKNFRDVPPTYVSAFEGGGVSGEAQSEFAAQGQAEGGNLNVGASVTGGAPLGGGGGGQLHERRRKTLKGVYRYYAPAHLFQVSPGSTTTSLRDQGMADSDFEHVSFLPMQECPWYVSELAVLGTSIPENGPRKKGDREDFVLSPPVVRANRVGQQVFADFKEVKAYFDGFKATSLLIAENYHALLTQWVMSQKESADFLNATQDSATSTISPQKISSKFAAVAGHDNSSIDAEVQRAAREVGVHLHGPADAAMVKDSPARARDLLAVAKGIKQIELGIVDEQAKRVRLDERFNQFKKVYEKRNGIRALYNIPHGPLEDGRFSIDTKTGILHTSEPLCHVDKPIFFHGAGAIVVADGAVSVTYGYELQENSIKGWTSFLFQAADATKDAASREPQFVGVCRSSPVKAMTVPMPGRLYELDEGTPVNFNACLSEALERAAEVLDVPSVVVGHTYEFSGFHSFPLDAGVSSVQFIWAGDVARTHLAINAPAARMPLGPGQRRGGGVGQTVSIDIRDSLERVSNEN